MTIWVSFNLSCKLKMISSIVPHEYVTVFQQVQIVLFDHKKKSYLFDKKGEFVDVFCQKDLVC